MSISHSVAARNAIANAVVALVDIGATYPNGRLVLRDASGNAIALMQLSLPAFQAAAQGASAANAITADPAPTAGAVAATYEVQDRNGAVVWAGAVGPTGDIGYPNQPIPPASPVNVTGLTYAASP